MRLPRFEQEAVRWTRQVVVYRARRAEPEVACAPSIAGRPFFASIIAAAVQRLAMDGERHRLTLRQTRRAVPIIKGGRKVYR